MATWQTEQFLGIFATITILKTGELINRSFPFPVITNDVHILSFAVMFSLLVLIFKMFD